MAVRGVKLIPVNHAADRRGSLAAVEFDGLPFQPRRAFVVYDVPNAEQRGEHAHRECAQFLVCVSGSVMCSVDDGKERDEYRLTSPDVGLLIPPLTWGAQHGYSRGAVLLVLASHPYDPADYLRDRRSFRAALRDALVSG